MYRKTCHIHNTPTHKLNMLVGVGTRALHAEQTFTGECLAVLEITC